jgi:vacuolar-type H+-ATPase subunit E/Vma4
VAAESRHPVAEPLLRRLEREGEEEAERILKDARSRAAAILRERERQLASRRQEALERRERELTVEDQREEAEAEHRARRELLTAQKQVLESAIAEIERLAKERVARCDPAMVEWHVAAAREALTYLPPGEVVVRCPPEMVEPLTTGLAQQSRPFTVASDPNIGAGIVVQSSDGYATVDATVRAIVESLRPHLAIEILHRIEENER